jgi:nicotinate-nucleotide adenylyltransferase
METGNADRKRAAERGAPVIAGGRQLPVAFAGMRIGLLGGSFNPAHEGHRHASLVALKRLALQRVWWLVSPQNPLKPERATAPLDARLTRAREIARHPQIVVTDIERALGTRYTIDTIRALRQRFGRIRFVWIMGADNFATLKHWKRWQAIMATVPVAVIARPGYGFAAVASPAAQRFARRRLPEHRARALAQKKPPAWLYLHAPLNPLSSTELRAASPWPPRGGAAGGAAGPRARKPAGAPRSGGNRKNGRSRRGGGAKSA